jgi:hypothetical protein
MPMSWLTRLAALVALAHTSSAFVFQVADDTVNECGPAAFTWSKGTAPYSIAVIVSRPANLGEETNERPNSQLVRLGNPPIPH